MPAIVVSVTVAVHVEGWPAGIVDGRQVIDVLVVRRFTVTLAGLAVLLLPR